MTEGAQHLNLAAEALAHFSRRGLIRKKDLHRLGALRDRVANLVYLTQSALAEYADDLVIADPLSRFECHEC